MATLKDTPIKDALAKYGAYESNKEDETKVTPVKDALMKYGAYDDAEDKGVTPETDSNIFAEPDTLRKDDLKKGNNATDIRKYMLNRFGDDFRFDGPIKDDEMVEKFFNHMRGFNTNLVSTAGEVRWVSSASDEEKAAANRAFELYDRTGNVFTNDGFFGAVDGVRDYMWAAAKDPTNYIGLLTGGLAKAGALGGSVGGKAAVRAALAAGRKEAVATMTTEAGKKGLKDAAGQFRTKTIAQMAKNGVTSEASKRAAYEAAVRESTIMRREMIKDAQRKALAELRKRGDKRALMATTAIDGTLAALNDYQIQSVYEEIDPQYQYSVGQTAFSSLFGTVAGGAQLVGQAMRGASGLDAAELSTSIAKARAKNQKQISDATAKEARMLTKKQEDRAIKLVMDNAKSWSDKLASYKTMYDENLLNAAPSDLIKQMILGDTGDGKSDSLVKIFNEMVAEKQSQGLNVKIDRNTRVSDLLTNVVYRMSDDQLMEVNKALASTGIKFGELTTLRQPIADFLAGDASEAGKTLNAWSQARKLTNAALLRADDVVSKAVGNVMEKEAEKASRFKGVAYGQNVWRRMLVSSPATTMVNVAGFSQYMIGHTLADVLSGTSLTLAGLATPGAKGVELRRMGRVYMNTVAERARHLMDPFTTHDAYMGFLKDNKAASKVLFETVAGGVERTGKRYGIDDTKQWYRVTEKIANGSANVTGVDIQDSFTKSQMFMTEMDKYLQLKHKMSLKQALKEGRSDLIDNDVLGAALDGTMKSVFSKDYTTDDQLLGAVAKWVEELSNLPIFGTVLPFGRFMNNTVATAYQWLAAGAVQPMMAIMKRETLDISHLEAAARSTVGITALALAMRFDEEQLDAGRPYHELDAGNGNYVDVKNHFPFSLWLAIGRAANLSRKGEMVPKEIIEGVGAQLAVGQTAKDVQFGNDLYALLGMFNNMDADAQRVSLDALYQKTGSIVAGFTRPLDALNKMVGYINDTDTAIDKRQASGLTRASLEATKYVDNLIEMVTDDLSGVTGEPLRVALREGDQKDPNIISRIFGFNVVPKRTSGEIVYSIAEKHPYMANSRTNNAAYDKLFNENFAPIFKREADKLLNDKEFLAMPLDKQRTRVQTVKNRVSKELKSLMENYGDTETRKQSLIKKTLSKGTAEEKRRARAFMKEQGADGPMSEWTFKQLQMYNTYIDLEREYE